jgi:6-phosphogluconolactonase (cycloisomerase 2 family)
VSLAAPPKQRCGRAREPPNERNGPKSAVETGACLGRVHPTDTKSPRFFCLDPVAKILYAANADEGFSVQQNTDTIVPLKINQANGMLTPTGQVIRTSSPCTVVFAGA